MAKPTKKLKKASLIKEALDAAIVEELGTYTPEVLAELVSEHLKQVMRKAVLHHVGVELTGFGDVRVAYNSPLKARLEQAAQLFLSALVIEQPVLSKSEKAELTKNYAASYKEYLRNHVANLVEDRACNDVTELTDIFAPETSEADDVN